MQVAPNIEDIQPLVRSILERSDYFIAISSGAEADEDGRSSVVVEDDGTRDKLIERHLRTKGFCCVVEPLLIGDVRDQIDFAGIIDVEIMVKLMLNPDQNSKTDSGGADVGIASAIKATLQALCGATRHPGGERFKMTPQAFYLSTFDPGLWSYDLIFRKEARV